MSQKPATRLYIEDDLADGAVIGLSSDHAHFLRSVLRLETGRTVGLFNGRDGEWLAEIDGIGKGWASLTLRAKVRDQAASPDLWLYFAPIKRARLDFLVQKATELGASQIQPVITRRTVVERVKADRLRANVVEASEQCERLDLPAVGDPLPLAAALDRHPAERPVLVCAEFGDAPPMADVLSTLPDGGCTILVGPEGGFTGEEQASLAGRDGLYPVGLGPRILRAETAAVAALTLFQAIRGDWDARPAVRR